MIWLRKKGRVKVNLSGRSDVERRVVLKLEELYNSQWNDVRMYQFYMENVVVEGDIMVFGNFYDLTHHVGMSSDWWLCYVELVINDNFETVEVRKI